jgi:hypothetical protein
MDYPEVTFFGSFLEIFSLHKCCRAVLNGDSDSPSNCASESILPMARQYFFSAHNWVYSR